MRAFWRDGAMPTCGFSEGELTVVFAARARHLLRIEEQQRLAQVGVTDFQSEETTWKRQPTIIMK